MNENRLYTHRNLAFRGVNRLIEGDPPRRTTGLFEQTGQVSCGLARAQMDQIALP